jgi:hypothetical protein
VDTGQADGGVLTLGWREWVSLPELGLRRIKAKVDTGARTSALHAYQLDEFRQDGERWIRFKIHPKQYRTDLEVTCQARVKDVRLVSDSGGHREQRYVIETPVRVRDEEWLIEITLTARDDMRFRMLLGRSALKRRAVVDPARSYLARRPKKSQAMR